MVDLSHVHLTKVTKLGQHVGALCSQDRKEQEDRWEAPSISCISYAPSLSWHLSWLTSLELVETDLF